MEKRTFKKNNQFDRVVRDIMKKNPDGIIKMCADHGYSPRSSQELYLQITEIVKDGGEDGVRELMSHHPDRMLILESALPKKWYDGVPMDRGYYNRGVGMGISGAKYWIPYYGDQNTQWVGGAVSGRAIQFDGGESMMPTFKTDRTQKVLIVVIVIILICIFIKMS